MVQKRRTTQFPDVKPDFIIASDLHLRDTQPECWEDDYMETQTRMLGTVRAMQEHYGVPVLSGGDTFDKYRLTPDMEVYAWNNLPNDYYTVAGQHDLKYNTMSNLMSSTLGLFFLSARIGLLGEAAMCCQGNKLGRENLFIQGLVVAGQHWGVPMPVSDWDILVMHKLTWCSEPYPGVTEGNAFELLERLPTDKPHLVISGDNHQDFVIDDGVNCIINPGSFMIQRASEMEHTPAVYLWSREDWCNPVQYPLWSPDAPTYRVTREHIDAEARREEELSAFVANLIENQEVALSFRDNMEEVIRNADHRQVRRILKESIAEED